MQKTLYIPIDTTLNYEFECPLLVKRYDTIKLKFAVFNMGILQDLSGQTIDVIIRKKDGTTIEKTIENKNLNIATITLDKNVTACVGEVEGEIIISDAGGQATSNSFIFTVSNSLTEDIDIKSKDDIETLEDMRAIIEAYKNEITAIGESTQAVEALNNIKDYIDNNLSGLSSQNIKASKNITDLTTQNDSASSNITELENLNKTAADKLKEFEDYDTNNIVSTLNSHTTQLNAIVQINLQNYKSLVKNEDWSPAIEKAIEDNSIGEIYIPPSQTIYNFSRTIVLGDNNSLFISQGATLIASEEMDVFIKKHSSITNLTNKYNFYNIIHGKGVINCNSKAKIGISVGNYRGLDIEDVFILNPIQYGIVSKGDGCEYACELKVNKINIEVENSNTIISPTGIFVNSTDNHFSDIILVDTLIGIDAESASNKFFRCHHWMRDRIKNSDLGCISFKSTGMNTFDTCYADTSNIGFLFNQGDLLINCNCFNSPYFCAKNVIAYKLSYDNPNKRTSLINCYCQGGGADSMITKAFDGVINDNVYIFNCKMIGYTTTDFPDTPTLGATKLWATNVYIKNKMYCVSANINNSDIAIDDNKVLNINSHPCPVFMPAPDSTNSQGANGYMSYNDNYLYVHTAKGWKRVILESF